MVERMAKIAGEKIMDNLAQKRLDYWLEICHRLNKEIVEKKALRNLALKRAKEWYKKSHETNSNTDNQNTRSSRLNCIDDIFSL